MTAVPGARANRRLSYAAAARILATRDPVIARLIADAGLPRPRRPQDSPFAALVRAIVYQQLAGAAVAAIHGRLIAVLDGDVQPEAVLVLSDQSLRAVGLSANKAASLRDLATRWSTGRSCCPRVGCPGKATKRSSLAVIDTIVKLTGGCPPRPWEAVGAAFNRAVSTMKEREPRSRWREPEGTREGWAGTGDHHEAGPSSGWRCCPLYK
jgi:hypothetical protein